MNKDDDYVFFKIFIEPHYIDIINFLTYASGDCELANDIAQDTIVDSHFKTFEIKSKLSD